MTLEDFIAEAERLAKPSENLSFEGSGAPAGFWHGYSEDSPIISIKFRGRWLTLFTDRRAFGGKRVRVTGAPLRSSTPLYATPAKSLPPIEGIFAHGSVVLDAYLKQHGWDRRNRYNAYSTDTPPGQYGRLWQQTFPIYQQGIVAVCGGWHFTWPDNDWHDLLDAELVLWVLQDAEPWVEVFLKDQRFVIRNRIT